MRGFKRVLSAEASHRVLAAVAPFSTVELDGSTVYASPTLSLLDNSSLFRIDDSVARVEVLRGGPSPIYSSGQPGVTVNFIQKNSETDPGGGGDERRVDIYYGGKTADGWYASIGGFYRTANGVRNTQYPADDGAEMTANVLGIRLAEVDATIPCTKCTRFGAPNSGHEGMEPDHGRRNSIALSV